MNDRHRRTIGIVGIAAGALLSAPLMSLLASPLASNRLRRNDPRRNDIGPVHDRRVRRNV